MSISRNELWCTICSSEGHTKYYCKFNDALDPAVLRIQIETLCDICEGVTNHATRDCPHNLRNVHPKWCHICEENNHSTQECRLNGKKTEQTFTQCIIHRWSTRMSTKVEMVTEVEVVEAIKVVDEEDEEILVEDEVEDDITASIVGKMTTSVQISQSKT
jgi:hypothetical protein